MDCALRIDLLGTAYIDGSYIVAVQWRGSASERAMADIRDISDEEARRLIDLEEGHYQDVKRIAIAPAKLSESVSAFANSSGGELFIGVGEDKTSSEERRFWHGFADQEAANAHIQVVEGLLPLGNHYQAEFLRSRVATGLVMHLIVFKTRNIVLATNSVPYVRDPFTSPCLRASDWVGSPG